MIYFENLPENISQSKKNSASYLQQICEFSAANTRFEQNFY
jgi:hypothetical protein